MKRCYRDARRCRVRPGIGGQLGLALLLALALAFALTGVGQAATDVLDQHNPHPEIVYSSGPSLGAPTDSGNYGSYPRIGQSFTAGITGTLDRVKLVLGQAGTFPGDAAVDVQIYATNNLYYPTGSPLASALVPVSSISTNFPGGWVEADFSPGASVINNTVYAIVLTCDTNCGTSGLIEWNTSECSSGPPAYTQVCDYPRGNQYYLKGTDWSTQYVDVFDDHIFQTYVIPSDTLVPTTVTLASTNPASIPYGTSSINLSATALATTQAGSVPVTTGKIAFSVTSTDGNTFYCSTAPIAVDGSGTASGTCSFSPLPDAGSYLVTATYTDSSDIYGASSTSAGLSVTPATPTLTFDLSTLPAKTYGNSSFKVAKYASSNSNGAITFALGNGSTGCSVSSDGTVTISGAGTCVIAANQAATTDYTAAGPVSSSFTIAQATPTVSWNPPPKILYYGQSLGISYFDPGANATGVGYPNPELVTGSFDYTYSGTTNGGQSISGTATSSTVLPAGSYTLTATFTSSNPNYTSGGTQSVSQQIKQTTPKVSWQIDTTLPTTTFAGYTVYKMPYGTAFTSGELNATVTNPYTGSSVAGTFTYKYIPNGTTDVVAVGTVLPVKSLQPAPANLYVVKAFFTPDDTGDFNNVVSTNFNLFEVDPVPLKVTANGQTMTYGGSVPDFTVSYDSFVNGDDASKLSGNLSCIVKDQSGNQVDPSTARPGTYTIDCSGSTLSDINYTISYASGTLTITTIETTTTVTTNPSLPYGATSVSLGATVTSANSDYTVNEGTVTFTVTTSDGTVLCTSQATAVTNGAVSNVACDFTTPPGAGSYTITATYADDATNAIFSGSSGKGTLAINGLDTTTKVTSNPSVAYGTAGVSLSATVTGTGSNPPVVNEGAVTFKITGSDGTVYCTSQAAPVSDGAVSDISCDFATLPDVGTYTITASYVDTDSNFNPSSDDTGNLTITPVATTTTTTSSPTVAVGSGSVQLTASVTAVNGPNGLKVDHGTVTFTVKNQQGTTIGTASGTVSGGQASASFNIPAGMPTGVYTISASYEDAKGDFLDSTSTNTGTLTITNDVVVAGGEPIIVKHNYWALVQLQVIDVNGKNISSRTLKVTAQNLAPAGQSWNGKNGNFVYPFQFGQIGKGNGYQLSINSRPLSIGDYTLSYTIAGDPVIHTVTIRVVP